MQEDVMRKHIDLYVNGFSEDVGEQGIAAVHELFARAHAAGIIPETTKSDFV
jgi:1,4-dihydroxy-6-naphthoate synthase